MSHYVGPNGRLYHKPAHGRWIALTFVAFAVAAVVIAGKPLIASAFGMVGL